MKKHRIVLYSLILSLLAVSARAGECDPPPLFSSADCMVAGEQFSPVTDLPTEFSTGLVAIGGGFAVTDRHEDAIVFFDRTGRRTRSLEYPSYEPSALAFDGKRLVAADLSNGKIYFLDPDTGECVHTIDSPISPVTGLACDTDGRLWVAAKGNEELQLVDPADGTTLASIQAPTARVTALAYDGDGYLWVADASRDMLYLVDIDSGYTIFQLDAPGPVANGLWYDDSGLFVSDYQLDRLFVADVVALNGRCLRSDERRGKATLYNEVQNLGPGRITGGTIAVAVPVDGPNQELDSVTMTEGAERRCDQWGQDVAVYELGELPPGKSLKVELTGIGTFYRISWKIYPHLVGPLSEIPEEIARDYLADADKYRIHSDYIQGKVKEVVGEETNPYFIARRLYDFLIGRINYQMVGGWDIAPTVIERGTGSCSEYTFAYVSLCRAAGIPARYVGSMVLRGEDASVDTAYHRWAEIYLPRIGWIPVDVNAGDRKWQGDRCVSFGGIANRFLITTRGGGDSTLMHWGYNAEVDYRTEGKANVRVEGFAEWDVVEKASQ